jgi:hypothetical protein
MATLTVTITEAVTLSSSDRGTSNTFSTAITEVDHRILDLTTAYINYVEFATARGAGQYADGTLSYIRITNLDSSALVNIRVRGADYTSWFKLDPGGSFILTDQTSDAIADTTGSPGLANLDSLALLTNSVGSQAEIFVGIA